MQFKDYLINESSIYLSQKIGDILTAVQDLEQNIKNMGSRQATANALAIVNQIRAILHTNWPKYEMKYLGSLQKVGVAIMKAIDEKDDLTTVIPAVGVELQKLSGSLGKPLNNLASESPSPEEAKPKMQEPQEMPESEKRENPPQ